MFNNKRTKDRVDRPFDFHKLRDVNFGNGAAEDDELLAECFFITDKVEKYFKRPYNYVLSPKGAGKSALFKVLVDNIVDKDEFDYSQYSIIPINDAFGFKDEKYLDPEKFTQDTRMNLTVSWALFIISKLFDDIKSNYSDKAGYSKLKDNISLISDFKERFNLYDLKDLISELSFIISFTANAQEFSVQPKISRNKRTKKISINKLLKDINEFYKSINKKALILIDRIDNFVQKEEYKLQTKYIQGLFDSIEEIRPLKFIHPTVFLRSDLFYTYESDLEYDKLVDRILELEWDMGETLNFIVYRLETNDYFYNEFRPFLEYFIEQDLKNEVVNQISGKYSKISNIFSRLITRNKTSKFLDAKNPFNYRISEKYLNMFFPEFVTVDDTQHCFVEWIETYLIDAKQFINPRLIILFFNTLIECENNYRKSFDTSRFIKPKKYSNEIKYEIFHDSSFENAYKTIQKHSLRTIYMLLKKLEYRNLFKAINIITMKKRIFKYGDIKYKNYVNDSSDYESFLKYLQLLGYCKLDNNTKTYTIPNLYKSKLILE